MTILWGDTGKVTYGAYKQATITLPTPRETPITSVNLPTTEPGTAQISYTVQSSDFSSFSGQQPLNIQYVPFIFACGKTGAAATVISYRISLNGVSQATGALSSIAANNFYTVNVGKYIKVNVGDVVTLSLWSNQSDTTFVYHAFTTLFTRLQLSKPSNILTNVTFGSMIAFPTLTQAPSPQGNAGSPQPTLIYPTSSTSISMSNVGFTFPALTQEQTNGYQLMRSSYGDSNNSVGAGNSTTNQTNMWKNYLPTTISFREINP